MESALSFLSRSFLFDPIFIYEKQIWLFYNQTYRKRKNKIISITQYKVISKMSDPNPPPQPNPGDPVPQPDPNNPEPMPVGSRQT